MILGGTKQWYHKMAQCPLIEQLEILNHLMACMLPPTKTHELHSRGPRWLSKVMRGCNGEITWNMCCSTSKEVCHPKICKHRPYFWFLCRTTPHNNQYMELMDNNSKHRTWALKLPSQKNKMHITYKTCEWCKCKHPSMMRKMVLGGYLTLLITASSGYVKTIQESQWFSCMNWPCKGGY